MNKLLLVYVDEFERNVIAEYTPCECGCGAYEPYVVISREDINDAWFIELEEGVNPVFDTEEILNELFNEECHLIDIRVIDQCLFCKDCE